MKQKTRPGRTFPAGKLQGPTAPDVGPGAPPSRWVFVIAAAVTFAVNWGADRVTKALAVSLLQGRDPVSFLGDLVVLKFTVNTGAFLSLGQAWPEPLKMAVLLALPVLVCGAALVWAVAGEKSLVRSVLIVTIAAGGVGNLGDRLFNHFQVIDFLNFGVGPLRTGILNVADLSVTFGVLAYLLLGTKKAAR
jgi:signal peptidase II